MQDSPRVLVVVLNWNKQDYLLSALASLSRADTGSADILVVDNGSDIDPGPEINRLWPAVKFIRNPENLGGAAGFNTGIRYALEKGHYDYVWLLDEDVEVDGSALQYLLETAREHPGAYLVGSKIYHYGSKVIQECGGLIDWRNARVVPQKKGLHDKADTREVMEVDYAPACSLLVNLRYAQRIGVMNESYFVLWDDMEWGARTRYSGLEVIVDERAMVWHHSGGSTKQQLWRKYYYTRNRLLFFHEYLSKDKPRKFILYLLTLEARLAAQRDFDSGFHSAAFATRLGIKASREGTAGRLEQVLVDHEVTREPAVNEVRQNGLGTDLQRSVFLRFGGEEGIAETVDWSAFKGGWAKSCLLVKALKGNVAVIGYKPHVLLAAARRRYILHAGSLYQLSPGGIFACLRSLCCAAACDISARTRSLVYKGGI